MDEEIEKPFPIEFIVILILVALANDIAEIFFDILDFTGVGLAGEAIMEPANLVLDVFFTGIFWWKVGPGGATITQYIGDLLEPLLIPGRTLTVALGMWIANHPSSALGKVATTAASLEKGNVGGALNEAEGVAQTASKEISTAEKQIQGGASKESGEETGPATASEEPPQEGQSSGNEQGGGEGQESSQGDIFKNPLDNPVGTAGEEAFNPSEDRIQEGKLEASTDEDLPKAA